MVHVIPGFFGSNVAQLSGDSFPEEFVTTAPVDEALDATLLRSLMS